MVHYGIGSSDEESNIVNPALVAEARRAMSNILGKELAEIVAAIAADPADGENDYFVSLPEIYTVDTDVADLMGLVAKTANSYHRIARFCGMAKAQYTLAEGAYKHKFKTHKVGRSEAEREKAGLEAAAEEYEALLTVESIYNMAEKLEGIARIKSESSRKILDKVQAMTMASHREERGDIGRVNTSNAYSPY